MLRLLGRSRFFAQMRTGALISCIESIAFDSLDRVFLICSSLIVVSILSLLVLSIVGVTFCRLTLKLVRFPTCIFAAQPFCARSSPDARSRVNAKLS